jgi:hypothetical protein
LAQPLRGVKHGGPAIRIAGPLNSAGIPCIATFCIFRIGRPHDVFGHASHSKGLKMASSRLLGVILLIAGVALLIVGVNASHSLADSLSNTFTGKFTEKTTWYMVGGGAAALLGLCMTVMGGKHA